jgi:hypothetical protein
MLLSRYGRDERAQVGEHQVGLLQGSEVPTRRNLAPMNDIVGLLGKRARPVAEKSRNEPG